MTGLKRKITEKVSEKVIETDLCFYRERTPRRERHRFWDASTVLTCSKVITEGGFLTPSMNQWHDLKERYKNFNLSSNN